MPAIDDFPIPDLICRQFRALLGAAGADIRSVPRMNHDHLWGIRPIKANIWLIRQLGIDLWRGLAELQEIMTCRLRPNLPPLMD